MRPITELTHKGVEWNWGKTQDKAFAEVKRLLTEAPVLAYFDSKKQLVVQCDSSGKGIGAALLQDGRPIAYASRALTDAETRYSTIEKEMLAIVYSLEKWHQYTYGRTVIVNSDHKPLESITRKPLDRAPKRLQGMLVRALAYDIDVQYLEGKKMVLADTLSRAYINNTDNDPQADFASINAVSFLPMRQERLEEIRRESENDPSLKLLKDTINHGWPDKNCVPPLISEYFGVRDELAVTDGLIFRGERLVVPRSMKKAIVADIHVGHTGVDSCLRRSRESVYWPGMTNDIREFIQRCQQCREQEQGQAKETLRSHELPERSWQKVGADLFSINDKNYLVTVCYFSNFWEIDKLYDTTSRTVIQKLKNHFARYGKPDTLITDNASQFSSDRFHSFMKKWDIIHNTSSPHYPKSNGKAESAVKSAKRMLRKTCDTEDPYLALLNIRNTPQQGVDLSAAQRLLGRRMKTMIPTTHNLLKPDPDNKNVVDKLKLKQKIQQWYYNRSAKDLPVLEEGDCVRIKPHTMGDKTWKKAEVKRRLSERSYEVQKSNGQLLRRNRVQLRASREDPPSSDEASDDHGHDHGHVSIEQEPPAEQDVPQDVSLQEPEVPVARSRPKRTIKLPKKYDSFIMGK